MSRSTALRASTAGLAAAALLLPTAAAEAAPTSVTALVSDTTPRVAQVVTVTGTVSPAATTAVQLQRRRGDVWVPVRNSTSSASGSYSVALPTSTFVGAAGYRVVADGTASPTVAVDIDGAGSPASYRLFPRARGYSYDHWNPCGTISYRVNTAHAPATAVAEVQGAVSRIQVQTGVRFRYAGTTTGAPTGPQGSYPAGTQLVFTWPAGGLGGPAGIGSFSAGSTRDVNGNPVMETVRGLVQADPTVYARLAAGFGSGPATGYQGTRQQLLMHEIGHVMGLDHTPSSLQIMYPSMGHKPAIWGDGDAAGLTRLGVTGFACIAPAASHARTPDATGVVIRRTP